MLTSNIQDELRARLKLLATPLMDDNAEMQEIISHVVEANNIVAASFLQEGFVLHEKMLAAYAGFLGAMGITLETGVQSSEFVKKLLKEKEVGDG